MDYLNKVLIGDALEVLRTLPSNSVQCCVTSPPYYGLRDYGTATWEGGDPACDHVEMAVGMSDKNTLGHNGHLPPSNAANVGRVKQYRDTCGKCGAKRVDLQIGLEDTPEAYVAKLVEVFREVKRVLRDDGTLWLNIGDSYNSAPAGNSDATMSAKQRSNNGSLARWGQGKMVDGLKPKDLIGIPWMVAFALRADGWYLRSDIIWHKTNVMPESVKDRPTKAHEYMFLLSKSRRYFYDAEAIKEIGAGRLDRGKGRQGWKGENLEEEKGRNKRTVWEIPTGAYKGAHFATFPPALIEPCILSGTSAHGCCSKCLSPYERMVEREAHYEKRQDRGQPNGVNGQVDSTGWRPATLTDKGWQPTCTCFGHFELIDWPREYDEDGDETVASQLRPPRRVFVPDGEMPEPVPCVVLDPFVGSGTTAVVAERLGRRYTGIDINPEYISMAEERIASGKRG